MGTKISFEQTVARSNWHRPLFFSTWVSLTGSVGVTSSFTWISRELRILKFAAAQEVNRFVLWWLLYLKKPKKYASILFKQIQFHKMSQKIFAFSFCKVPLGACYRPQRSWGKVMFLHVSVILFTGGGRSCLSACWETRPPTPGSRHPPRADTPQEHPLRSACWEIRPTSGRYASYWNAYLLIKWKPLFAFDGCPFDLSNVAFTQHQRTAINPLWTGKKTGDFGDKCEQGHGKDGVTCKKKLQMRMSKLTVTVPMLNRTWAPSTSLTNRCSWMT